LSPKTSPKSQFDTHRTSPRHWGTQLDRSREGRHHDRGSAHHEPVRRGAVVAALIALTFWLDRRFRLFSFLGTAILVITGAALLVNARIIPPSVPVEVQQTINPFYTFASDYAVPLAIVLLLSTAGLRSLRLLGRPVFLA
jgi:hypothetical protein